MEALIFVFIFIILPVYLVLNSGRKRKIKAALIAAGHDVADNLYFTSDMYLAFDFEKGLIIVGKGAKEKKYPFAMLTKWNWDFDDGSLDIKLFFKDPANPSYLFSFGSQSGGRKSAQRIYDTLEAFGL